MSEELSLFPNKEEGRLRSPEESFENEKKHIMELYGIILDPKEITYKDGTWYVKGIELNEWLDITGDKSTDQIYRNPKDR